MTPGFFICVNFNNSHFTVKYVNSIQALEGVDDFPIQIVVVDNNSAESDFLLLKEFTKNIENVSLIRNPENTGYFNGLNLGLELLNVNDILFAVIGNNDLEFDKSFLKQLIDFDKRRKENVLVIAPNIINFDGDNQNPVSINRLSSSRRLFLNIYFLNYYVGVSTYGIIQFTKKLLKRSSKKHANKEMEITLGYGACYVLTHDFFRFYSKLDDSTFLYGEEALISNQIHSVNGVMTYLPDLKVNHFEHASARNNESKANYKITQDAYKKYRRYL
jgi:GT2 family glycosyltransferase